MFPGLKPFLMDACRVGGKTIQLKVFVHNLKIVLPPSHKLIAALLRRQSEQFKEVFRDEQAVILLKK